MDIYFFDLNVVRVLVNCNENVVGEGKDEVGERETTSVTSAYVPALVASSGTNKNIGKRLSPSLQTNKQTKRKIKPVLVWKNLKSKF